MGKKISLYGGKSNNLFLITLRRKVDENLNRKGKTMKFIE